MHDTRHYSKLIEYLIFSDSKLTMTVIEVRIKMKNLNKNNIIFKKDVNGVFFAIYVLVSRQHPPNVKGAGTWSIHEGDAK